MKKITFLTCFILLLGITVSKAQIITTYAGNGTAGYSGDGGQATAAELNNPAGVNSDAFGNMYIGDGSNNRIRVTNTSGIISTFAGNGTSGFSGDGGQATAAEINSPHGLAADASGNIYITDNGNNRIRKINTSGIITTIAGNGTAGFSGNGGQATAAEINAPTEITFDASGNAYIADNGNNRIRKINTSGVISTLAGNGTAGFSGDGGQATAAELNSPSDVYVDGSGNAYIADKSNFRVRKINTSGIITTIAGNGTAGFSGDGGQATVAEIKAPTGVRTDASGNVYIGDFNNNRMRKINGSGVISTFAGNGTAGYTGDGGQATAAEAENPGMMTFDQSGNIYFTERTENIIREVYLSLLVTTTVTANVSCNGGSNGSATVAVSHGTSSYTYSWTGGGTSTSYTGLTAGTYTVTVTDANGITGSATATITQPTPLTVSATAKYSAVCPGKTDTLKSTPSGGTSPYTYSWLPAPFGGMGCNTCQNTWVYPFGTTYTITTIDSHGCTATASTSITINPFPYVTVTGKENPILTGATDTLTASGGTSYVWSNAATTSSISFTLSAPATYSVLATNSYGCRDSAQYVIDTDKIGNGLSSSTPIRIVPTTTVISGSFSSNDSVQWFYFVPVDSTNQIIATSYALGMPVPHVHRVTLYDSTLNIIEDRNLPDEVGATEIRVDASGLHIGKRYLVRAARTPAHLDAGCSPTPSPTGVCHASTEWSFQLAVRDMPLFIPNDSGSESPSVSMLYYEGRGQVQDLNEIPRYDIKAYTQNTSPSIYLADSAVYFVESSLSKNRALDSCQRVEMTLTGTGVNSPQPLFKTGKDTAAGYLNYLLGRVPNGISKVYGYSRVVYKSVYPNIDMELYSNSAGPKIYFICGTGTTGSLANVQLKFRGADSIHIPSDSGLIIYTHLGKISFTPGYAYEDSAGHIVPTSWHANFEKISSNTVRFHTGTYNTNERLVIRMDVGRSLNSYPPIDNLDWSTYMGGNANDAFYGVTTDNANNTYATGQANSSNFPVLNGLYMSPKGLDAVVAKFANTTHARVWATFYGGSKIEQGNAIAVDNATKNVYFTGYTNSPGDFPLYGVPNYPSLNQGANNVDYDAFIVEINAAGTNGLWATYWGGGNGAINAYQNGEQGNGIVTDGLGNLYVVGGYINDITTPVTVPTYTVVGAYNSTAGTAWVAKFSLAGVTEWATTIGGANTVSPGSGTTLNGASVDGSGNLYVTGVSTETGYKIVNAGANATFIGGGNFNRDAVVTKFDASTNNVDWSTYYAGDGDDLGQAITNDAKGNVYVTGYSNSPQNTTSLITVTGPYNSSYVGTFPTQDAFIAEFTASSGAMTWSTYFGGSNNINGMGIAYDNNVGELFLTGFLYGGGGAPTMPLPATNPTGSYSVRTPLAYNAFIAGFAEWGYFWGSYLGGSNANNVDEALGMTVDGSDNLYIVGYTGSTDFPLVDNPSNAFFQPAFGGGTSNAFISQFNVSSISAVNNVEKPNEQISVYPNPTTEYITVSLELNESGNVEFDLYDILGQVVYNTESKEEAGKVYKQISLSNLSEGTYILKVKAGNNVYHQKIAKLE